MGFTLTRAAACAVVTVALAQPAAAEQDRPLMLLVGSSAAWNSNIFLVPDNVQSVFYVAPYVGLRFDQLVAQQEFQAKITETFYQYSSHSLDANALDYSGAWLWHVGPRVSGTINGGRSEAVNNFSQFQNTTGQSFNITTYNGNFNLDGLISGPWHLLLGSSFIQVTNSQPFSAQEDYRLYGFANTGVKYVTESGNSIAAINRWGQGNFMNQPVDPTTLLDNNFQEQENGLQSIWILSPKSTLSGRLTWLARRYQHFSQRDFSGPTYQFSYDWTLSAKLRLNFTASRDLAYYLTDQSSYTVTNTQSFTPSWHVGPKTVVRMDFERSTIAYRGPVIGPPFPLRGDTFLSALVGVDWTPLHNITLGASLQRSHRSSNIFVDEYNDTIAKLNASLMF